MDGWMDGWMAGCMRPRARAHASSQPAARAHALWMQSLDALRSDHALYACRTSGVPDHWSLHAYCMGRKRTIAAPVPSGSSGNDLFGEMKVNKQLATSTTAVILYTCTTDC